MAEENAGGEQNGAVLNDPVDVIIDKLLRYDCWLAPALIPLSFSVFWVFRHSFCLLVICL